MAPAAGIAAVWTTWALGIGVSGNADWPSGSESGKKSSSSKSNSSNKVKMLSILHSIFKNNGNIPFKIISDNLKHVSEYTDLSYERICDLSHIQLYKLYLILRERHREDFELFKENNRKKYDHGYHVVSKLNSHEKIEEFVKMWRNHFIDHMKPPYMPLGWSVDFRVKVEL